MTLPSPYALRKSWMTPDDIQDRVSPKSKSCPNFFIRKGFVPQRTFTQPISPRTPSIIISQIVVIPQIIHIYFNIQLHVTYIGVMSRRSSQRFYIINININSHANELIISLAHVSRDLHRIEAIRLVNTKSTK